MSVQFSSRKRLSALGRLETTPERSFFLKRREDVSQTVVLELVLEDSRGQVEVPIRAGVAEEGIDSRVVVDGGGGEEVAGVAAATEGAVEMADSRGGIHIAAAPLGHDGVEGYAKQRQVTNVQ